MLRSLDLNGAGRPKHERLRAHVEAEVASGRLRPGDLLPSELDLAARLGVSRGTVRQALAALEKEGRVRREHGRGTFVADPPAEAARAAPFALLVPETDAGFYPALLRGFEAAAAEEHRAVLVCNTGNDVDRQGNAILRALDAGAGGVALVPTSGPATPAYHVRQLQKQGVPVVCVHRPVEGAAAPLLALPYRRVGEIAGRAATDVGHRRAAFLSPGDTPSSREYLAGFRAGLEAAGGSAGDDAVVFGPGPRAAADIEGWVAGPLGRLMAAPGRPTVVFATFDSVAEAAYLVLLKAGLRVPGDVSVVGVGDARRDGVMARRLTSVTLDAAGAGRRAAALLGRMARGELPAGAAEAGVLATGLSAGESLGPPPR